MIAAGNDLTTASKRRNGMKKLSVFKISLAIMFVACLFVMIPSSYAEKKSEDRYRRLLFRSPRAPTPMMCVMLSRWKSTR